MSASREGMLPRVLVVEDDIAVRECLVFALIDSGYEVTAARDGVHALEILQNKVFDIILSDNRMPRMCGLDLYEQVRQSDADIPFVLFSAHVGDMTIPPGVEFMAKPVPPCCIIDKISELISGRAG